MADLTLAVAPGGEYNKVFVTLDSFRPELVLMEPEVANKVKNDFSHGSVDLGS